MLDLCAASIQKGFVHVFEAPKHEEKTAADIA